MSIGRHVVAGLGKAGSFAIAIAVLAAAPVRADEKVKIGLDLTVSGYHAGWFVAQKLGYFKEQGLDVTINRGYGSGDTVRKVQKGEIDLGFHHTANLVIANSNGADLRVVMSYLVQELCAAFSSVEDGNVTTPKIMEGKTWGGPKTGVCTDILPAVLLAGGADATKVTTRIVQQAERFPMLAANTIQATDSYLDKAYYIRKELAKANKTMVYFRFADYVKMYSSSMSVTRETMEKRPEMIEKAIAAVIKGLTFASKNPDEAARIIVELHPEADKDYIRESVDLLLFAMWDEHNKAKGLGYIDAGKMEGERDLLVKYLKLKTSVPVDKLFTNQFVEAAYKRLGAK
jgi:NitT/TauT family transport system substrate-binding protein